MRPLDIAWGDFLTLSFLALILLRRMVVVSDVFFNPNSVRIINPTRLAESLWVYCIWLTIVVFIMTRHEWWRRVVMVIAIICDPQV